MGDEQTTSIGMNPTPGYRYSSGIGYVMIPIDLTRSEYIKTCLDTGTVSIITEDGSIMHRVPVSEQCWDQIFFPKSHESYGAIVFWVSESIHQYPYIIATTKRPEQSPNRSEDQFKVVKSFNDGFVEISGSAKDKSINLILNGINGGRINIEANDTEERAVVGVQVQGNIEMLSTKETKLTQYEKYSIKTEALEGDDYSSTEQTPTRQIHHTKRFEIRTQQELTEIQAMVLGNTFKDLFDMFIIELSKSTVTTMLGVMPLMNAVQIAEFRTKTEQILSKLSFTE